VQVVDTNAFQLAHSPVGGIVRFPSRVVWFSV